MRHTINVSLPRRQSQCRDVTFAGPKKTTNLYPVVGIGLPVGSTLVVSPTYEPQHYKTNKMTCTPVDSPNAVTLHLPDRKRPPTYFERPLPTCRCRESTAAVAREDPCANDDLKDRMSPNYERPDTVTVHCFQGNILMRQFSYHTSFKMKQ